jgi:hypothetical protein
MNWYGAGFSLKIKVSWLKALKDCSVPKWPKAGMPNDCSFEYYLIMGLLWLIRNER